MWKDVSVCLGSGHWYAGRGGGKKHFREKSENATHNSSVILFAVDRWAENPIMLDSGEFPSLPSQCANRQTQTVRDTGLEVLTHVHAYSFS